MGTRPTKPEGCNLVELYKFTAQEWKFSQNGFTMLLIVGVRFETYEGIDESVFIYHPIIMIWKNNRINNIQVNLPAKNDAHGFLAFRSRES